MTHRLHNSGRFSTVFERGDFLTVRSALEALCVELDQNGLCSDMVQRTEIIVAEVANNIVEHGCTSSRNIARTLKWRIAGTTLCIMVSDHGREIPDTVFREQIGFPDSAQLPEGGFGLGLIQTLCDSLRYKRIKGRNYLLLKISQ